MAAIGYRRALAGLLLVAVLCTGCNLLTLPFFLLPGMDPKIDPEWKLASDDKTKEVRVLILASSGMETRPEFLRVDRELSRLVAQQMEANFKKNEEKVKIVPTSRVEKYKDDHPDWHSEPPEKIGKYFQADYVINLEVNSITLYEPGSSNTLFRGRANISVDVVDVKHPSEGPVYRKEYATEYPKVRGPIPADNTDTNPARFRQMFLTAVARELSWLFTAHLVEDDHRCE